MKITNQNIAEKIQNYLQQKISRAELIDWAENTLIENEFENKQSRDIVAQLGVADVRAFGLQWEDFYDALIVDQRKNEKRIPWEQAKERLNRKRKLEN
ncbi:MAG: hypothetical protein ABI723_18115 [Bacteroidia bacterium]